MPGKEFTPEEIVILRENPNTFHVSQNRLEFTLEAKKRILELAEAGRSQSAILKELGYDTDMLGRNRVKNLVYYIRNETKSPIGLHEGIKRSRSKRMSVDQIADLGDDEESYAALKREVIFLREEVEILKKSR